MTVLDAAGASCVKVDDEQPQLLQYAGHPPVLLAILPLVRPVRSTLLTVQRQQLTTRTSHTTTVSQPPHTWTVD